MPPVPGDGEARCQRVAPGLLRCCYGVATVLLRYCERVDPLCISCTSLVHPSFIPYTSLVSECALRSHYGRLNCISTRLDKQYGMAGNTRPHVVVLGGGFGGLTFCQHFHHAGAQVTLVDRANHHLFQPLLYQVATAGLSAPDIAQPIRSILAARQYPARTG